MCAVRKYYLINVLLYPSVSLETPSIDCFEWRAVAVDSKWELWIGKHYLESMVLRCHHPTGYYCDSDRFAGVARGQTMCALEIPHTECMANRCRTNSSSQSWHTWLHSCPDESCLRSCRYLVHFPSCDVPAFEDCVAAVVASGRCVVDGAADFVAVDGYARPSTDPVDISKHLVVNVAEFYRRLCRPNSKFLVLKLVLVPHTQPPAADSSDASPLPL